MQQINGNIHIQMQRNLAEDVSSEGGAISCSEPKIWGYATD